MKHEKGFTLIELMVTVVILAIIVSVAIPSYGDYVTRGKIPEATSTLSSLRVSMEQYYQDNRTYQSGTTTNCGVVMPTGMNAKNFAFACVAPTQNTFTITATGQAGMVGFIYTVDNANNKQTTGAPAGWGAGATAPAGQIPPNPTINCWVTNKGGKC